MKVVLRWLSEDGEIPSRSGTLLVILSLSHANKCELWTLIVNA